MLGVALPVGLVRWRRPPVGGVADTRERFDMTDSTTETTPETTPDFSSILPIALKRFAKGKDAFDKYCGGVAQMYDCDESVFRAYFVTAQMTAARDSDFATFSKRVDGWRATKSLVAILKSGTEFITAHSIAAVKEDDKVITPASTPRLSYSLTFVPGIEEVKTDGKVTTAAKADSVILKVTQGRASTRSSSGGTKKGRISAFVAWKSVKADEDFTIVQTKDSNKKVNGYKVDGRWVAKGGLTKFLKDVYPTCATLDKMRQYPEMNI